MDLATYQVKDLLLLFGVLLGGGTVGALGTKWLNRPVDNATARKIAQESAKLAKEADAGDIANLRAIIQEVRASEARKTDRIDALEARLEKLEERERHMLTRAAVHEAWDQLAFAFIATRDANFPHPPPLAADRRLPTGEPDDN